MSEPEPNPEQAPDIEYVADIQGIPVYVNPNFVSGTVICKNAQGELIGFLANVARVEIAR